MSSGLSTIDVEGHFNDGHAQRWSACVGPMCRLWLQLQYQNNFKNSC